MGSIAVLGSINMDLVVRQPRRPDLGETIFGTRFTTGPGGKGLNQAVASARAGATVSVLGAVGDDPFGHELIELMARERIDVARVHLDASAATGIAQISVTDDGENSIVVVPGANAFDVLDDEDRAVIEGASHLVGQLERPLPLLREAFAFARSRGVITVLTPAPVQGGLDDLVALTDVLIPNAGEACELTGEADAEAAAVALSRRSGTVVVTDGARGAIVAQAGELVARVPARRVDPIDTTGAGDTFAGVLVAWLAQGAPLDEALRAATAGASISVTREGAATSAPQRDDIVAVLHG